MASILEHVVFSTLDENQKTRVRAYAKAPVLSEMDTYELFKHQQALAMPFAFWDKQINKIEQFISSSDDLKSATGESIAVLKDDLSFAFYIFSARYKLAFDQGLGYELPDHAVQLEKCTKLMNALTVFSGMSEQITDPYLPSVSDDGIQNALDWMGYWNERRLYWVWAGRGGLLGATISLLPDNFFYKKQALGALDVPVPLTGGLSWALYYFRCAIRLGIVLRHTISGPWMSKEEQHIPWTERLSFHLNKVKFDLINDFFWACGNLACFFWLCGNPVADYYGGVITTLLLLMDVSVTLWAYWEAHLQYVQDMERISSAIQTLMLNEINNVHQIAGLKYTQRQVKIEWDYKLYSLYADILYAVSLMLAFTLLYSCFLPLAAVSAASALWMGVAGTVLCFSLNACFSVIKQVIDICKSVELANNVANDYAKQGLSEFDSQLLKSEWSYHQKIIEYKQACLIRSILIDCLVPPVVFLSFVFTPLFVGLPIVFAGFVLAVASYYYVNEHYQHDITCLPKSSPDIALPSPVVTLGFFGKVTEVLREGCCTEPDVETLTR